MVNTHISSRDHRQPRHRRSGDKPRYRAADGQGATGFALYGKGLLPDRYCLQWFGATFISYTRAASLSRVHDRSAV